MRIIISPAKTMKVDNDTFAPRQKPIFLEDTQKILTYLQSLTYNELKSVWKSSDRLAELNFERIKNMDLYNNLTPGIVSFEGLQYQHMGAGIMTGEQLDYIEKHLRILSGFYGILKPFDGIVPYRLEMQSKLIDWEFTSLYGFWKDKIAKNIFAETDCIINLASKEYSKSIEKYLKDEIKFINCIFAELIDGRVIEKGTLAKMARGEMVRFMAENNIDQPQDIIKFDRLGYSYKKELFYKNNYVFIKEELKAKIYE